MNKSGHNHFAAPASLLLLLAVWLPSLGVAQAPGAPGAATLSARSASTAINLAAMGRTVISNAMDQFEQRVSTHPVTVARVVRRRELITGRSFSSYASAAANPWTLWGQGTYRVFTSQTETTPSEIKGRHYGAFAGIDYRNTQDEMFGIAFQRAYTRTSIDGTAPTSQRFSAKEVSVYPYFKSRLNDNASVWVIAGVGTGTLQVNDADTPEFTTKLERFMIAGGARYSLRGSGKMLDYALKADFFVARTETAARADRLNFIGADAERLRLGMEAGYNCNLKGDQFFTSRFNLYTRLDNGEADNGIGLEISVNASYINIRNGVTIGGHLNSTLLHTNRAFNEVGLGLTFSIDPGVAQEGFSLSLDVATGAGTPALDYRPGGGNVVLTLTHFIGG